MTELCKTLVAILFVVLLAPASAGAVEANSTGTTLHIGYLDLANDPRYLLDNAYAGIVLRTLGRPWPGAELGVADAALLGRVTGQTFSLLHKTAASPAELADDGRALEKAGAHFILTDLPADALVGLQKALANDPVLLMNVSADDDRLRAADCSAKVVHIIPSNAMRADALMEYLVSKNWTRIAILQGPDPRDAARVAALKRSAAKFGASIVAEKPFTLSNDPRLRNEDNVALMSAGLDADVLFVADAVGKFARFVPYRTSVPILVVGDAGLDGVAWHWSWFRNGAPQAQHRFEKLASPRRMNSAAWAAWVAVKAVTQAAVRTGSDDFGKMRDELLGPNLRLDGAKGPAMSFRPWNHQLRQPMLLASSDAVIATAPLPQFLHQSDTLDTLGIDRNESRCRLDEKQ